jgi:hypothetical protein
MYNPLSGSYNYAASFLTKDNFERVGRKSNMWRYGFQIQGELDFQLSTNSVLKVRAQYDNSTVMNASAANMFLNNANNSQSKGNSFEVGFDYTQKFLSDNDNKNSLIRDIIFNLIGNYAGSYTETYNPDHGDDLFRYGHVGTFITHRRNTYSFGRMVINNVEQDAWIQQASPEEYLIDYTPSQYNPGLSAYTSQLYYGEDFSPLRDAYAGTQYAYNRNTSNIRMFGGLINGDLPSSVYGIANNIGNVTSTYTKGEQQFIYAAAKVTANIGDPVFPHSVEFGFQYDQSINRGYSLNAVRLWGLMKQEVNVHFINALDLQNPIIDESGTYPVVNYNYNYNASAQTAFDRALRQSLGLAVGGTDIIDIDSYDPSKFSLDMFSANELFNSGNSLVQYYGYDHTGAKITGKRGLEEFFNNKQGRILGAWEPIYMAGYVLDQFQIQNLIFNVGVRVNRFDGNQMVLKDPYLLWNAFTVGDFRANGSNGSSSSYMIPSTMGDNYVVYVDSRKGMPGMDDVEITGYRNGNTWYNANGEIISDPYAIAGSAARPIPYLKELTDTENPTEVSVNAFKDYEPEIVVEPRIAFSFPATDKSNFKASYEIVSSRPSSGTWQANYMYYLPEFFLSLGDGVLSNPDLKSEKITNYELGFEQALTKDSRVSITAYYKQTSDLINMIQYVGADPVGTYFTYGNQDFRTIKGTTFDYYLRYSKNFNFNINYTLQYAEGTVGLTTGTIRSLIRAGYPNIKMMFPTDQDYRHQIKSLVTFSYGGGTDYNGPVTTKKVVDANGEERVKTIRWLQNTGISLQATLSSGAPYTRLYSQTQQTIVGSFSGSRLPWWYRVDLQVQKGFDIKIGKKNTTLTVYCIISNLLNTKSITSVFGVTGDPTDDGYLTDPETQTAIQGQENAAAYRAYYSMMLNNSYFNYIPARTIDIGVRYAF